MNLSDIFGPEVTAEIKALVRDRILKGKRANLATRKDIPRETIKLVLLLIVGMGANLIELTKGEQAILQGVGERRLRKPRKRRQ
jgi:hypothetical protein